MIPAVEIEPVVVKVKSVGDAHFARCAGKVASSTSDPAFAASRAAAKHFGLPDTAIRLLPEGKGNFLALPGWQATSEYRTATELVRNHINRMYS